MKFANRAGEKIQTANPRKRGRKKNDVRFDAKGPLFQALGVACPGQDGRDDHHPGNAGDVAEYFGELDIHLLQGLLHVLHVPAGRADQGGPLPQIGPERQVFSSGRKAAASRPTPCSR